MILFFLKKTKKIAEKLYIYQNQVFTSAIRFISLHRILPHYLIDAR